MYTHLNVTYIYISVYSVVSGCGISIYLYTLWYLGPVYLYICIHCGIWVWYIYISVYSVVYVCDISVYLYTLWYLGVVYLYIYIPVYSVVYLCIVLY